MDNLQRITHSFLVATIVKTSGGIEPSYQKKRFSTFNNSILEFKQWLLDNDCHDVCMESTRYHYTLYIISKLPALDSLFKCANLLSPSTFFRTNPTLAKNIYVRNFSAVRLIIIRVIVFCSR